MIATGWTMLRSRDEDERVEMHRNVTKEDLARQAFYPLTLPLTVGPGSFSVAITLGANAPKHSGFDFTATIAALIGMTLIAVSIVLCYGFSDRLAKFIGPTAMSVILRLSSFLLLCIGIQILRKGVKALLILSR